MLNEEKKVYNHPYSRRQFLKGLGALGVLSVVPWLGACQADTPVVAGILGEHSQMAADVMAVLLPEDQLGPSSQQLHSYEYLNWVLADENYDVDIKNMIIDGFARLATFSQEQFKKPYGKMSKSDIISLVEQALEYDWGENLMARLVSMILDSLVIDPIYGTNENEVGWKMLGHIPGSPRATKKNKYPEILDRKKELVIISGLDDLLS